jgi:hypothetical protein
VGDGQISQVPISFFAATGRPDPARVYVTATGDGTLQGEDRRELERELEIHNTIPAAAKEVGDIASKAGDVALETYKDTIYGGILGGILRVLRLARTPILGNKLDYILGKAKGNEHTIARTQEMAASLKRIGLGDTPETRKYLTAHLTAVLNDARNIARTQENSRMVRESLLVGPKGAVKLESIWEDKKLITVNIYGGDP